MTTGDAAREALLVRIKDGLNRSGSRTAELRRANSRLIWLSLIASAVATMLAAVTAAAGPLAGEGPPAWRLTCGSIAVLTGMSGLLTGAHQRLNVSEKLASAIACTGKLRSMELALTVTGRDPGEVARDYEDLVATYQEFLT